MYQILIADDHEIIRYTLRLILKKIIPNVIIDEAKDLNEAQDRLRKKSYQLIIFDLNFSGVDNTFVFDFLNQKSEDICVLIFSAYSEENYAIRCLKAGANGYLSKEASQSEIELAIKEIINNKRYISEKVSRILINESLSNKVSRIDTSILSIKEFEIAQLLVKGKSNKEISDSLFLHPSTVSTYKSRIFGKLNVSNVMELREYLL
jgi:two-component system invasion response regulator UvrY